MLQSAGDAYLFSTKEVRVKEIMSNSECEDEPSVGTDASPVVHVDGFEVLDSEGTVLKGPERDDVPKIAQEFGALTLERTDGGEEEDIPVLERVDQEEKDEPLREVDIDFCKILMLYTLRPIGSAKKKGGVQSYMLEFFNRFHYTAEEILANPGVLENLGGRPISDDPAVENREQRFGQDIGTFLQSPNPEDVAQVEKMMQRNKEIHETMAVLQVLDEEPKVDIAPFSAVPYLRSLDVLPKSVDEETGVADWYTVVNMATTKLRTAAVGRQSAIDAPWIYGEWWNEVGQHICQTRPSEDDTLARFREIPAHVSYFLPDTLLVDSMTERLFDRRFVRALFINEDPARPWLVRSIRAIVDEDNLRPYMEFVKELQQPLFDATQQHCAEFFGVQRKLAKVYANNL